MTILTFIIAVVALIIAILAYWRSGGVGELKNQVKSLSSLTDSLREKSADALDKMEKLFRGEEEKEKKKAESKTEKKKEKD